MKFGPFTLLPGMLAVEPSSIEEWEASVRPLFDFQRYAPWWIGDLVNFGEAQFGDDFWQVVPEDASIDMMKRYMRVAREFPVTERNSDVSFTHHQLVISFTPKIRRALLRKAQEERMPTDEFSRFIKSLKQGV